jgi:hypothetical protein
MHAAIYDAVNAIDATHETYLVHIQHVSPRASQEAAVAGAAHEILVALYPEFQTTLDQQFDQSLAQANISAQMRMPAKRSARQWPTLSSTTP